MSVELHLPDLPEVPIALGPARGAAARPHPPWHLWLRSLLSAYLPLLLMALLALGTWWLVKHTPGAPESGAPLAPRLEPDYTMQDFAIVRFASDGHVNLRMQGDRLRHFPATDRVEIDEVRIHAIGDDGRVTDAAARRALVNGDASEVQLIGGAQVRSQLAGTDTLEIESEFLHAFLRFERVRSHLPVVVRHGASEIRAGGIDFDHLNQQLQLAAPVRTRVLPGRLRR
jgi:lipopolysaccharide export system protein LptC